MTAYKIPSPCFPSFVSQEAREKRKKVLAGVRTRRKVIYAEYKKHLQAAMQVQKQS